MTPSAAAAANSFSAAAAVVLFSSAASPEVASRTAGRTRSGGTKLAGESGRCLLTITHGLVGSVSECCGPGAVADGGDARPPAGPPTTSRASESPAGCLPASPTARQRRSASTVHARGQAGSRPWRAGRRIGLGRGAGGQGREAGARQQEAAEGPAARRFRAGFLPSRRPVRVVVAHLC